jgi:hypothetical protein
VKHTRAGGDPSMHYSKYALPTLLRVFFDALSLFLHSSPFQQVGCQPVDQTLSPGMLIELIDTAVFKKWLW